MKTVFFAAFGAASLGATASADLVGWTANIRTASTGGFLVNVFAVVDNASDMLVNVSGGEDGSILTTSNGGFLQGSGNRSVFAPDGAQSWTTLDSFLTVGGAYNPTNGNWFGEACTGDVPWNATYFNTDAGTTVSVSAFNTQTNEAGFVNRFTDNIPIAAGWYRNGPPFATAQNLGVLTNRLFSSSAAAAAGNLGFMVAQLYVSELSLPGTGESGKFIQWRMKATIERPDGSADNRMFEFQIGVPAPGVLALVSVAGLARSRRRRR